MSAEHDHHPDERGPEGSDSAATFSHETVLAFAELHMHMSHLAGAFDQWKRIPYEVALPGEPTLARLLTTFMIIKVFAVDEAIAIFKKSHLGQDERVIRFAQATRPLLADVARFVPALRGMRNRLGAHGKPDAGYVRPSPGVALGHPDAPRDTRELAFVVGVYLQYFALAIAVFPDLLAQANDYDSREVDKLPPRPPGPTDAEHRDRLHKLSEQVCAELGIEPVPIIAYHW